MQKEITVLSLFDGMSCGQIALNELGYKIKYYASDIDKYAIEQTQYNFPNTTQLGDVSQWQNWNIDWKNIDMLIGGSPCQGFSFAGKQLNFSDPRSKLFFVYVDILNHIRKVNPQVCFMLENVNMKREYLRVISEYLGVFPVNLNSNLVSAQNRNRWYWSNIKTKDIGLFSELWTDIPTPQDRKILLKDILQPESEIDNKYYLKPETVSNLLKWDARQKKNGNGFRLELKNGEDKSTAVTTNATHSSASLIKLDNHKLRRLTPTECARLQTIPSWYKWKVSDTQQYKMLGNGWTVEIIKHIFSYINL